jgi:peptidoglycan L-alanyl-D-glutamate endopeptidase CwlK
MDQLTLDRIKLLHPDWRKEVEKAYLHINNKLLGKGVRLRFSSTHRSKERQDDLYSYGRTKFYDSSGRRLGRVTNARGGQSIHNYGLAFDIVLLIDKDQDGTFESATWDTMVDFDGDGKSDWMEVVDGFKSILDVEWGGDWKSFKDRPHFEKSKSNWKDLSVLPTFIDPTNGIEYPVLIG